VCSTGERQLFTSKSIKAGHYLLFFFAVVTVSVLQGVGVRGIGKGCMRCTAKGACAARPRVFALHGPCPCTVSTW